MSRPVFAMLASVAVAVLLVIPVPRSLAQDPPRRTTWLSVVSQPGDPLGRGESWGFTPANARMQFSGSQGDFRLQADANYTWYSVELTAPAGGQLTTGRYTGARRAQFNGSHPGLAVQGEGRACNTDTGSFVIHSLVTSPEGPVVELDVSFTQYCDGAQEPLHGRLLYRAPQAQPVPLTSLHPATVRGEPTTFTAVAPAGSTVSFYDRGRKLASVTADADHLARLTTASLGVGTHTITARSSGHSSPKITQQVYRNRRSFWYRSDRGAEIGQGTSGTYAPAWTTFSISGTRSRLVLNAVSTDGWEVAVEPPTGTLLKPGRYRAAQENATTHSAGLYLDGGGTSCEEEHGSFQILSIHATDAGTVTQAAVKYVLYCTGGGPYANRGVIRYTTP